VAFTAHGAQGDDERRVEAFGGGTCDNLRCSRGKRLAYKLNRLADEVAEAGSQAWVLQGFDRPTQRVEVFIPHWAAIIHRAVM
jgi:hypothetical protein